MAVEVYGFVITQFPYSIYQISNLNSPDIRRLILNMQEGDLLNINGLGSLMVVDFEVKKRSFKGNELRELYITTMPA